MPWFKSRRTGELTHVVSPAADVVSEITPQVYIGPQYFRNGKSRLVEQGFTHSVDMQLEYDSGSMGFGLDHHCHLPTVDDEAPSHDHVLSGIQFIEDAVREGGKVYVHCASGVGRSPTLVAAYLVNTGMSLDEALSLIVNARPIVHPSDEQMRFLRSFESELRQRS